jgi:DNA-binding MarR family transcriptional regulator
MSLLTFSPVPPLPKTPARRPAPSSPAPAAGSDPGLDAFSGALGEFMRAVRRARGRFAAEDPQNELTLSQYGVLDALLDAPGPMTPGELAVAAGVAAPTATRTLGGLEGDGLVVRERDERDRRLVRISLTDLGRERVAAKRERMHAWRAQLYASLPPAERRQAARLLERLAIAVEDLR